MSAPARGGHAGPPLRLLPLVRDLDDIQVCSLDFEHAERLARLKAMGIAMEDMVAANLAYRSAQQSGVGTSIDW